MYKRNNNHNEITFETLVLVFVVFGLGGCAAQAGIRFLRGARKATEKNTKPE